MSAPVFAPLPEECEATGGEHTWGYHSPALDGPCAWFPAGEYCDECGRPQPEEDRW
jgi:hypothetical protein